MRTRGRGGANRSEPEDAMDAAEEEALTPKQRMEARKLADANARMQQMNLHVQTNLAAQVSVQVRKQQMMAGSISPTAPSRPSPRHPRAQSDSLGDVQPASSGRPHGPLPRPPRIASAFQGDGMPVSSGSGRVENNPSRGSTLLLLRFQ
jgi:hypothetical protein